MATTSETTSPKPTPLPVRIIFGLLGFAACVLGFVFLAPYGIWWVGVLSGLLWMVPSLVLRKSVAGPWVSVAMILAVCDLQQGTFYLAAWLFGVAGMTIFLIPVLLVLTLLMKVADKYLLPKLEAKLDEWEGEARRARGC